MRRCRQRHDGKFAENPCLHPCCCRYGIPKCWRGKLCESWCYLRFLTARLHGFSIGRADVPTPSGIHSPPRRSFEREFEVLIGAVQRLPVPRASECPTPSNQEG